MASIWTNDGNKWRLTSPSGFPDEATLHKLIQEAPGILPLAGEPEIAILGSEVNLGSGYADLIGVESNGRPVVIEVKLSRNNEARRAVVAQILAYAAYLHGYTVNALEEGPLKTSLQEEGHGNILDAVQAAGLENAISDGQEFTAAIEKSLSDGRFRLVFVLDEVPPELSTLVAYLENIASELVIDLVAVNSFDINGTQAVLPQRVTPERHDATVKEKVTADSAERFEGAEVFRVSIANAPEENQADLRRLLDWCCALESRHLAKLTTAKGKSGRYTLVPRIASDKAGLATVWNESNRASLSLNETVFKRKAAEYLDRVEMLIAPKTIRQSVYEFSDELLDTLTEAYEAAANS